MPKNEWYQPKISDWHSKNYKDEKDDPPCFRTPLHSRRRPQAQYYGENCDRCDLNRKPNNPLLNSISREEGLKLKDSQHSEEYDDSLQPPRLPFFDSHKPALFVQSSLRISGHGPNALLQCRKFT